MTDDLQGGNARAHRPHSPDKCWNSKQKPTIQAPLAPLSHLLLVLSAACQRQVFSRARANSPQSMASEGEEFDMEEDYEDEGDFEEEGEEDEQIEDGA